MCCIWIRAKSKVCYSFLWSPSPTLVRLKSENSSWTCLLCRFWFSCRIWVFLDLLMVAFYYHVNYHLQIQLSSVLKGFTFQNVPDQWRQKVLLFHLTLHLSDSLNDLVQILWQGTELLDVLVETCFKRDCNASQGYSICNIW